MLPVILLILKIIGITILCLLGLILLIILIVLFVPVRYRLKAKADDKAGFSYDLNVKVTWLLHIVNVLFVMPSDEKLRVRLFVFKVFPRKKEIKDKKDKASKTEKTEEDKGPVEYHEPGPDENVITEEKPSEDLRTDEPDSPTGIEKIPDNKDNKKKKDKKEKKSKNKKPRKSFKERFNGLIAGIRQKFINTRDKVDDIRKNTQYYIDIYNSDEFRSAFSLCKNKLISILKSILPKKIRGNVIFGKEDSPDTVGMVFSAYSVLYPKVGRSFVLTPEFEKDIIDADIYVKGRIFVFVLLFGALRIYFDKNVKKILKMIKKEK